MKKQKIGKVLFWIGVALLIIKFIANWVQNGVLRDNTPETIIGTGWAFGETYDSLFSLALPLGFLLSLLGALLYSSKKGSFFWLWALVSVVALVVGLLWSPSTHVPAVYGIGAAIISLSFLGVLWGWIKTYNTYEGLALTGKQIQLLGYSFLYITALFLCNYIGNPMNPTAIGFPLVSGYSILITLSIGFVLLSIGHYLTGQQKVSE